MENDIFGEFERSFRLSKTEPVNHMPVPKFGNRAAIRSKRRAQKQARKQNRK
ncbi:hypothetical protein fHeYen902_265 [Yersinia phage fHe-Yen9-02]|nr:hypothetical protein fHeYen902_265 [Yersinia phage fHe-Yen9-02]